MLTIAALLPAGRLEAATAAGFRLVAETENFSFYTRDGRQPDAKRCQRFLTETAEKLGQPIEGRSAYYLYRHPEEIDLNMSGRNIGITEVTTGRIHSVREFHPHEIVHRVADLLGDPGPFFSEGLAVAMGNQGKWYGQPVDKIAREVLRERTFRSLVEDFPHIAPEHSYPASGSFVGWLIRNHGGLPRLSEFLRACGRAGFPREVRFRAIYGFGFDEASAAWAASLSPAIAVSDAR